MGKKSRRQRDKTSSDEDYTHAPPLMRGLLIKGHAIRAAVSAQRAGMRSAAAGARIRESIFSSQKVQPVALRLLATERKYSYSDAEWENYQRVWEARNEILAAHPEDEDAFDQYLCAVAGNQFAKMYQCMTVRPDEESYVTYPLKYILVDLRAVWRWRRVRPHWRRFHRRLCSHCHKHANLTEPRYLVCSGCGVARYCSEACQAADWPTHQSICCAPPMEDRYADLKSDVNELEAMGIGIGRPTLGASSVF